MTSTNLSDVVLTEKAKIVVLMQRQCAWRLMDILARSGTPPPELTFECEHVALYLAELVIEETSQSNRLRSAHLFELVLSGYIDLLQLVTTPHLTGMKRMAMRLMNASIGPKLLRDKYRNFKQSYSEFLRSEYRTEKLRHADELSAFVYCLVHRLRLMRTSLGQPACDRIGKPEVEAVREQIIMYFTELTRAL
jgi:hypothetical protein